MSGRHLGAVAAFVLCLSTLAAGAASAQVGHSPSSSPYHDIYKGHTFTAIGGYIMLRANALLILPEGQLEAPAGAVVHVLRLDETSHQADPAF